MPRALKRPVSSELINYFDVALFRRESRLRNENVEKPLSQRRQHRVTAVVTVR